MFDREVLTQTIADALETMAFVTLSPAESPAAPLAACQVAIRFGHPVPAELQLVTPRALGHYMAGSVLGLDVDDPSLDQRGLDMLRELMNVACGALLARTGTAGEPARSDTSLHMSLPTCIEFEPSDWAAFTADPRTTVLDADGHIIAFRVVDL